MNFECFVCFEKCTDENFAINHLRKVHKIKEHTIELKCLVNFTFCNKSFLTYSGLRKHLKTCSKNKPSHSAESLEVLAAKNFAMFNCKALDSSNNLLF